MGKESFLFSKEVVDGGMVSAVGEGFKQKVNFQCQMPNERGSI